MRIQGVTEQVLPIRDRRLKLLCYTSAADSPDKHTHSRALAPYRIAEKSNRANENKIKRYGTS